MSTITIHSSVEQIQNAYDLLSTVTQTGRKASAQLYESLGVHPEDFQAQAELSAIITQIAKGAISPEYSCETQQVYYRNPEGDIVATFKPGGVTRANDETFFRRMAFQMGTPNSAVSGIMATFNFAQLPPVLASEINTDAFDPLEDAFSSNCESSDEDDPHDSIVFDSTSSKEEAFAEITDLSFAQEVTRSGKRFIFLPEPVNKKELIGLRSLVQLTGTLAGVLEPWVPSQESYLMPFIQTVIFASVLGMRDFKSDALVGSTIIDSEEIMAAEVDRQSSPRPRPSLHLPVLNDPRAVHSLTQDQLKEIRTWVLSWNIANLVEYARTQQIRYRMSDLEELEVPEDSDEPQVIRYKDLNFFLENDEGREPEFFPRISSKAKDLFSEEQIRAFENRLVRLQQIFKELDEEGKNWPTATLMGIVGLVDEQYGEYLEEMCKARTAELRRQKSSGLTPRIIRALYVDSPRADVFVHALTQQAGRFNLQEKVRDRTSSLPEMLLHQQNEGQRDDSGPAESATVGSVHRTTSADPSIFYTSLSRIGLNPYQASPFAEESPK